MMPLMFASRTLRAELVADDGVLLERQGSRILVRAPEQIRGKLEVRGLGIIDVPHVAQAEVVLLVKLGGPQAVERFPDPHPQEQLLGVPVSVVTVSPFEASAPHKVMLALASHGAPGAPSPAG